MRKIIVNEGAFKDDIVEPLNTLSAKLHQLHRDAGMASFTVGTVRERLRNGGRPLGFPDAVDKLAARIKAAESEWEEIYAQLAGVVIRFGRDTD